MEALLRAVNATNDFEAEMAGRFGGGNGAASDEARGIWLLCRNNILMLDCLLRPWTT